MVAIWAGQISLLGLGMSMSDSHAESDSEAGGFVWFLLSKAVQAAFLGWHAVPFALCASGQLIRRHEDLLKIRFHAVVFWLTLLSFAVALLLLILG